MQVHIVKKMHIIFLQLLTIVASFPHRGTIGPSGFELVTRSPYIPDAYYSYRQYNDGRLENLVKPHNVQNIEKVVVVKDDDKQKHKNIEIHFKDGVRSMIMDFKMPPHYHRQGDNNMYNLDLNKLVRQLTSTTKDEIVSARLLAMKIQQKNNPHLNVNYDEIVNLATFFSSGRDTVDYGYSLDSIGKSMVEDELNSLPRVDKGDVMNINFVGTENTSDATSTRIYKSPIDTQSPDIIIFPTDTENIESSTACDTDTTEEEYVDDRTRLSAPVVASLLGG